MYAKKITVALCMLWQCFHLSSCSITYTKYSKLKALNWGLPLAGHKLNVTPIATSRVTNHIKCMAECGKTKGCVAINLGPSQTGQRECEMLDITRYSMYYFARLNAKFTVQPGWTYIGPKTKCDANPCAKGFVCLAQDSQEHETDYTCVDSATETCVPLGMESGKILDSAITASSYHNNEMIPAFARLNVHRGKCSWTMLDRNQQGEWIQIDLGDIILVTGVATQGGCIWSRWVTSYTVSYSSDGQNWEFYEESGSPKVFSGNADQTTAVTHAFKYPFGARYVKILPQSFVDWPALRMELYSSCVKN